MDGLIAQIFDSAYWEKAWQEAGRLRRKKEGNNNPASDTAKWDRRAAYFEKRVAGKNGSARINSIMAFLQDETVLVPGMRVVDVGCGNGSITVQLAAAAGRGEVFALDPSAKMLILLEKKVEAAALRNVHAIKERWQDVDLKERGWEGYFDLAFASMSPGVDSPETLKKLIAASRKYCYFSTFAGRNDRVRSEIWQIFTGSPPPKGDLDIIYPFNLLYAWGYRPSLRFFRHHRFYSLPPQDAVEEMYADFSASLGARDGLRETLERYVHAALEDGFFHYESEVYNGMLIWDVSRGHRGL